MSEIAANESARVFFALWPNADERSALAAWQPLCKKLCGGKPTPVQNLHNTLVFLGDVELARLEALQQAAEEAGGSAFQLVLNGARYWEHNHIVIAAPSSVPGNLTLLVQGLQQSLLHHQFKFDQRSYKPHVTLLRHAHWKDSPLPEMPVVVWNISEFALVRSANGGLGAHYEVLARFHV